MRLRDPKNSILTVEHDANCTLEASCCVTEKLISPCRACLYMGALDETPAKDKRA